MNEVQVYLSDDSHVTVSTTHNTTCGELLRKVLIKIDKDNKEKNYSLHLQYRLSGVRVAIDSEYIKDLVQSCYDPLEKIYLCSSNDSSEPVYYNTNYKSCYSQHTYTAATSTCKSTFLTAWNPGPEIKKDGSLHENTDSSHNIKRRKKPRLSMSRGSSQFNSQVGEISPYYENIEAAIEEEHSQVSFGHITGEMKGSGARNRHSSGIFEDVDSWLGERSILTENNFKTSKQHHDVKPELFDSFKRDSGISTIPRVQDLDDTEDYVEMKAASKIILPDTKQHVSKLSSCKSLEDLTSDVINEITDFSLSNQNIQHSLISPQHVYDYPSLTSSLHNPFPPDIPKRNSSLLTNRDSQISNEVLVQQGKRLSLLLNCNIESTENKSTIGTTVKAAFNKMRKVSLPAISVPRAKSPISSRQKRKVSVQVISPRVLSKHPSMEKVAPKPSAESPQSSGHLFVPGTTGMTGKRSHSFSHLKGDVDKNTEALHPPSVKSGSYDETGVRLVAPLSPKLFVSGNKITEDWTSQRIRKVATCSPPIRPPLPNFIQVSQEEKSSNFCTSKLPGDSPRKKPLVPPRPPNLINSSRKLSNDISHNIDNEKRHIRKGSHPMCFQINKELQDQVKSKSLHDLISFFTQ